SRYPDGDARRLERARQELCFLDMIILSFVVVWLAAPEAGEHLKPLIQQLRPRFGVRCFAQRLEVVIATTRAYAQDPPPLRHVIQRYSLARKHPGSASRQQRDKRTQQDRARAQGYRR